MRREHRHEREQMNHPRNSARIALTRTALSLCLLWTVACGRVPGPDEGAVEVYVHDQAGPSDRQIEAHLVTDVSVMVGFADRRSTQLGSTTRTSIVLGTSTDTTDLFGSTRNAPTGAYNRVRLVLDDISVEVRENSRFGADSVHHTKSLSITGGDSVVVFRQVPSFTLLGDVPVRVRVDLASPEWLTFDAVEAGEVNPEDLSGAVEIRTEIP